MDFSLNRLIGPTLLVATCAIVYIVKRSAPRSDNTPAANADPSSSAIASSKRKYPWSRGTIIALGLAVFYLLTFRLLSLSPPFVALDKGGPILMSFSFLFLGPFVAGFLTLYRPLSKDPWPIKIWIIAPWIPVFLNILLALSAVWEGIICVVFILPPAMVSASLGGVAAGLLHRYFRRRLTTKTLCSLAALPLLLAIVETHLHQPIQTRTVDTSIVIHASIPTVWQNIERVRPIAPSELRHSWANAIGFPRPVEATLSHEGVGGVRNATFERGLNFTETITDWIPNQRIVFTIKADTSAIPRTTLDEHVTVGGRFFDVLTGEYDLHPLPNGDTLLHLSSRERLSTDFNAYAAMWSDAVMRDMQSNILHVIRNRCEATPTPQQISLSTNERRQ
jgi:hypothetical protein